MALASSVVWEVRPNSGSSNNGGGFDPVSGTPGTDYSQQAAAQRKWISSGGDAAVQTYSADLAATNATSSVLTSASYSFVAADVGNIVNITSGTNFTAGRYQIVSVSGGAATLDSNATTGTGAGSGGSGYEGGSLSGFRVIYPGAAVAGNTIWQQSGTDTSGSNSTADFNTGSQTFPVNWYGYHIVRGDLQAESFDTSHSSDGFLLATNYPLIDVGTGAIRTLRATNFACLRITGNQTNALINYNSSGFVSTFWRCVLANSSTTSAAQTFQTQGIAYFVDCELTNEGVAGGYVVGMNGNQGTYFWGCRLVSQNGGIALNSSGAVISFEFCLLKCVSPTQIILKHSPNSNSSRLVNCTIIGASDVLSILDQSITSTMSLQLVNNQVSACNNFATNLRAQNGVTPQKCTLMASNNRLRLTGATYSGFANISDGGTAPGDITTSQSDADEYQGAASGDYRLSSTAVGKGNATPASLDTGAYQRKESTGSTGNSWAY